ncbi:MAG TPA: hypothetical protein VHJ20_04605 [Polyangia bacterium]|nr:hypothetical protein [Polyangia bacterium]
MGGVGGTFDGAAGDAADGSTADVSDGAAGDAVVDAAGGTGGVGGSGGMGGSVVAGSGGSIDAGIDGQTDGAADGSSGGAGGGSTGGVDGSVAIGPANQGPDFPHQAGNATNGQQVFRFETFGNEGFWTDAVKLPAGLVAAHVTPVQALALGLSVNVDALDTTTKAAITAELAASGTTGPLLNDAATTLKLLDENAVIGVVVKDTSGDGKLDVTAGDKVGVTCAVCHAITDGSIVPSPSNLGGGGIGHEIDGPTPHNLNLGAIFAAANNSRALFPLLQLKLVANGNKSTGRAPDSAAITVTSTEADVDAYLQNPAYYPLGSFDDGPDGNGAPEHISPFFRTDLSAPYGAPGDIARLDNFNNLVYTALLDPTTLVLPSGQTFLKALGGDAAGAELATSYLQVLTATGVIGPAGTTPGTGFPFITASLPAGVTAGSEDAPVGLRVDNQKLLDLNAYTDSLHAPAPPAGLDVAKVTSGLITFEQSCTSCHNVNQSVRVPSFVVAMSTVLPSYAPSVLVQRPVEAGIRPTAYAPIQNDPNTIFDDKMVVIEASRRGEVRGSALPLLLDLARKDRFLHDGEVVGLSSLLDPARGSGAPHPFFVADATARANVIEFLKSLRDTP